MLRRQVGLIACQDGDFRPHECFDRITHLDRAGLEGTHRPTVGGRDLGDITVGPGHAAGDAVVRTDEAGHEGRLWPVVQILGRAKLLKAAVTHHADAIGQHQCFGLVVGDINEGRAERRLQLLELDFHMLAKLQIEGAQGFIEQQQRRLENQAARDGHPLALSARQFIDALVRSITQSHPFQHGIAALHSLGPAHAAARQSKRDVFAHGHHRKQGQLLEHHVHRAAIRRHAAHALAADGDIPAIRSDEPGDHPQQRRLAAAGRTENGKETAAFDRERQGIHRHVIGEPLDHGLRHQIRRVQSAAFTRSSTRPSISSRPGGMAGYQ